MAKFADNLHFHTPGTLQRVTIYIDGDGWMLEHADDPSAEHVKAIFGATALPMPFLRDVRESQVRDVLERMHPGIVITRGADGGAVVAFDPAALKARVKRERMGFVTEGEVAQLAAHSLSRLWVLLVRCGACRFLAPAQDVAKIIAAVTATGDHVRDVAFPVEDRYL